MAIASGQDFVVKFKERGLVNATGLPIQEHCLPFSNLDMLLPAVDFGIFLVYENVVVEADTSLSLLMKTLKRSLGEALVTFYALQGEVVESSAGEPELLCNNRGVEFIEAYADVELVDLDLYDAESCLEGKLVPRRDGGVLCTQVTELKCGAIVVACTFDHRIADAYSAYMFLLTWSHLARSQPLTFLPTFCRSLLDSPRCRFVDPSIPRLYVPASSLPPPPTPHSPIVSRIYRISASNIGRLHSLSKATTKLRAFAAFLWQTIARSTENSCNMGIVIDGRNRLSSNIDNYFGNVLGVVYRTLAARDLRVMELSEVASVVEGMVREGMTKEHFLGLADWIEERRAGGVRSRIYCEEGAAVMVSSGRRFPMSRVDFGAGGPAFGSYHFGWGGRVGHVMPMPSAGASGDWVVYARLAAWQVRAVEEYGGGVFQPLATGHF